MVTSQAVTSQAVAAQSSTGRETEDTQANRRREQLASRIGAAVARRTGGNVRDLEVRVGPDGICLTGSCATFYTKQLAQTAAMGLAGDWPLTNSIDVNAGVDSRFKS